MLFPEICLCPLSGMGLKETFLFERAWINFGVSEGKSSDDMAVLTSGNQGSYLCGWPDQKLLNAIMKNQMQLAGLDVVEFQNI